jgi:hypothetical protein
MAMAMPIHWILNHPPSGIRGLRFRICAGFAFALRSGCFLVPLIAQLVLELRVCLSFSYIAYRISNIYTF